MRRAAVFALLAGLLSGLAAAQQPPAGRKAPPPPAKKDEKATPAAPLPDTANVAPAEEKSFKSADGVRLQGRFYKSTKGGNGPVVILMHEFKKDPNDSRWDGTAKLLAASGFNTLRFAFRGHGDLRTVHSKDISPEEFFLNPINRALVKGAATAATKTSLDAAKDLPDRYMPMLVQDLAAARTLLDLMNDAGECNTSSVYLVGAGEMVNLGFLFLAAEWHRERERLRTAFGGPVPVITAGRPPLGDVGAAGQDYAGAVWLGPLTDNAVFPPQAVKNWVDNVSGLKIRNETPMLFLYGGQDKQGKAGAKAFHDNVLRADAKASSGGTALPKVLFTTQREVKGAKNTGGGLLGNNLGTEQTMIEFLQAVEKDRKNRPRKTREFEKPLYIDVPSFGLLR